MRCVFFLAFQLGWLVTAVEWCVFVCNHNARGDHWKNSFSASPHFIQAVMANGKKKKDPLNECGVIWISGYPKRLFCLLLYQGFKPLLARGWWVVSTASLCGSTYISGVCWPTGCTCLSGSRVWGLFCWLQGACWLCLLRWKYQVTEIQFLQVNAIWLNT